MTKPYTSLAFILFFSLLMGCAQKKEVPKEKESKKESFTKINGVSFVASRDSLRQENIGPLRNINATYASIMPFGFIKSLDHPEVVYNQDRQWFGETKTGVSQYVDLLHKNNMKVMLKPQIWIWRGEYTGLLEMASETDWIQLENSYKNFILDYAELAETDGIEVFCIGTELETFIAQRPEYWRKLISEIREVYSGKLTYAANWDEYKRVPFWDILDFIGIDAYFPISESKTPSLEETKEGWQQWKTALKAFSHKASKKILFTEYGYRSVDFSGKEPWESNRSMNSLNLEAQQNLLEGLYQSVWKEDWFAGGFLWKWFLSHEKVGGIEDNQFTPQNKPAEAIVEKCYSEN